MDQRSHYSPRERKITMAPHASLYARFHEEAHREQHETNAFVFRVWTRLWWVKRLRWLATIWIEWDANRRARLAMEKLGLWNDAAEREHRENMFSYLIERENECRPGLPQS